MKSSSTNLTANKLITYTVIECDIAQATRTTTQSLNIDIHLWSARYHSGTHSLLRVPAMAEATESMVKIGSSVSSSVNEAMQSIFSIHPRP